MIKYSVIVAEDEPLTRQRIIDLLENQGNFNVIKGVSNGAEAVMAIKLYKPDIIFLDIMMPRLNGLEVLKELSPKDYKFLVFITAFENYAIQAFENEALDYLLKPFDLKRFMKLIERIERYMDMEQKKDTEKLIIKEKGEIFRIDLNEIIYIKAENNYVVIVLKNRSFKKRTKISFMFEYLNHKFLRVHRSYIINKSEILKMKHVKSGDYVITMSNHKAIISSKSYRDKIKFLIK
ncbi:MAG: LytTR family DNA-binding domain-containing protein [Bacteroidota bacterium]